MPGGYESLIVYQQAVLIFDLNDQFCKTYLDQYKDKRTIEQMIQAARSGKQNIVEGSLEKSSKLNINLTSVARASFGELLEDYKDFLRTRGFKLWSKDDPRLIPIRNMRIGTNESNLSHETNMSNLSNWTEDPERFANLMVTLLSKEGYLLDRMILSQEKKFVEEGGYTENLFKKRLENKKSNWSN
jgi:four helix bundle suffix protein